MRFSNITHELLAEMPEGKALIQSRMHRYYTLILVFTCLLHKIKFNARFFLKCGGLNYICVSQDKNYSYRDIINKHLPLRISISFRVSHDSSDTSYHLYSLYSRNVVSDPAREW